MSAMPERVFVCGKGAHAVLVTTGCDNPDCCRAFVPESRLLAAEARVREVEAELSQIKTVLADALAIWPNDTLEEQCKLLMRMWRRGTEFAMEADTFRAERDALVPLARFGMASLDDNTENYGPSAELDHAASLGVFTRITHNDGGVSWHDTPATTQARAILAREET